MKFHLKYVGVLIRILFSEAQCFIRNRRDQNKNFPRALFFLFIHPLILGPGCRYVRQSFMHLFSFDAIFSTYVPSDLHVFDGYSTSTVVSSGGSATLKSILGTFVSHCLGQPVSGSLDNIQATDFVALIESWQWAVAICISGKNKHEICISWKCYPWALKRTGEFLTRNAKG